MAQKIGIIGCSKSKHDPAEWGDADPDAQPGDDVDELELQHLYSSGFWTVKSRFGAEACDEWRILSAKFGLVEPSMIVTDTYEQTLHNMSDEEIEAWREQVRPQFAELAEQHPDATLEIVLGGPYREETGDILSEFPVDVNNPVESASGIGVQMKMLNEAVEEAQNASLSQY